MGWNRQTACACVLAACLGSASIHTLAAQSEPLAAVQFRRSVDATREPEPLEPEPEPLPECAGASIRLSGTFVNSRKPQRSFAMFHVSDKRAGEVYRVGMYVDKYQLESIEPRGVLLRGADGSCWLRIAGAGGKAPPAAAPIRRPAPAHKPRRTGPTAFSKAELDNAIRDLGGNKYEVKRELVTQAVARAARLSRTMKFAQVKRRGQVFGLHVRRLADAGLMSRLGLKKGDVVRTLNGLPLTSLDGALQAQKQVASAQNLSLLIMRNGSPLTLEYRLAR